MLQALQIQLESMANSPNSQHKLDYFISLIKLFLYSNLCIFAWLELQKTRQINVGWLDVGVCHLPSKPNPWKFMYNQGTSHQWGNDTIKKCLFGQQHLIPRILTFSIVGNKFGFKTHTLIKIYWAPKTEIGGCANIWLKDKTLDVALSGPLAWCIQIYSTPIPVTQ
jgi:hypothetical protein